MTKITSTKHWLLSNIELFLDANPGLSDQGFGWHACGSSSLVERIRDDKNVTIDKMDMVVEFLKTGVSNFSNGKTFNPITIKRRVYE